MNKARGPSLVVKTYLLGKRVSLFQPVDGFRVAIDTVILAAAVPAVEGDWVLDVGSGNGAAALCLGTRVRGVKVRGLECQGDLVALARDSASMNGLDDKIDFFTGNLLNPPGSIMKVKYDHVLANPPYIKANSGQAPKIAAKALATVEGDANLIDWLNFCFNMVSSRGTVTIVHRRDRLDEILNYLVEISGQITIMPLIPRIGIDPKRVLVQVTKGCRGPISWVPGLVLHGPAGAYSAKTEEILRNARQLFLSGSKIDDDFR